MTIPPPPPPVPPGWYPDPSGGDGRRYWNGTAWTDLPPPPQPALEEPRVGTATAIKVLLGMGALVLAGISLGAIANVDKSSRTSTESSRSTGRVIAGPTETKSGFTPAQDNAIESARSYLNYSAFSKQGLIRQLLVEKFSKADATFAVEFIENSGDVDWNQEAVKSAKSYLEYSSFSLDGLVRQLEVEGFTPAEAQYGASTAYEGR